MRWSAAASTQLIDLANERRSRADADVRQQIARLYTLTKLNGWNGLRAKEASKRRRASPAASTRQADDVDRHAPVGREIGDDDHRRATAMLAGPGRPDGRRAWRSRRCSRPAPSIYGGTDQVQRNIIGERVLGLPKDPDISRDVPFRELRVGTQSKSGS